MLRDSHCQGQLVPPLYRWKAFHYPISSSPGCQSSFLHPWGSQAETTSVWCSFRQHLWSSWGSVPAEFRLFYIPTGSRRLFSLSGANHIFFPPDFSSDHKASPSFSLCANLLPLLRKLSGQKVPQTTFTTASYCSPGKRYFTTGFCCHKAITTQALLIALLSTCDTKETTKQIVSHKEQTQKA